MFSWVVDRFSRVVDRFSWVEDMFLLAADRFSWVEDMFLWVEGSRKRVVSSG